MHAVRVEQQNGAEHVRRLGFQNVKQGGQRLRKRRAGSHQLQHLLLAGEERLVESAHGDVPRDAEQRGGFAEGIAQRAGVRLQPAVATLKAGDLKFQDGGFAAHDFGGEFTEGRAVLLRDERIKAMVLHLPERVGFDHPQPGGIHFEERAVGGEQLHALRLVINDGTEARFTHGQFARLAA